MLSFYAFISRPLVRGRSGKQENYSRSPCQTIFSQLESGNKLKQCFHIKYVEIYVTS